ncbi:hypothetical protein [Synechococcus sp. MIT S9504]|uniref:hypothetical protein n=1 Tax=Synechococcus sp. MIT S9504 TaxID=1801628 RepID=UPI0012E96DFA|nr:hypothetical protein [Synechococcus sp. MIT S9504]
MSALQPWRGWSIQINGGLPSQAAAASARRSLDQALPPLKTHLAEPSQDGVRNTAGAPTGHG